MHSMQYMVVVLMNIHPLEVVVIYILLIMPTLQQQVTLIWDIHINSQMDWFMDLLKLKTFLLVLNNSLLKKLKYLKLLILENINSL
jgi:hypothetical protein